MKATYFSNDHGQNGKSQNAYHAENCGMFPLTIAVKQISQAIKGFFKIPQRTIRSWLEQIGPSEAHHVGKYAVLCNFYDTEGIIDLLFDAMCNENTFIDEIDIFSDCRERYPKSWMI